MNLGGQIITVYRDCEVAFACVHLDYCNSLLYDINDGLLKKLQNIAAHMTTETRKFSLIKPVLRELHWLAISACITHKLAMMVSTAACIDWILQSTSTADCHVNGEPTASAVC